jgi:hypothetical protein
MEAAEFFETMVITHETRWFYNPKGYNLKAFNSLLVFTEKYQNITSSKAFTNFSKLFSFLLSILYNYFLNFIKGPLY